MQVSDRRITKVSLIDDNPGVRASYRLQIEDMGLEAVEVRDPIRDVEHLLSSFDPISEGVICDFQLTARDYAPTNGGELASRIFLKGVPVILCSRYDDLAISVRRLRHLIPAIVDPNALTEETVQAAFTRCVNEARGVYTADRRPRRTLVRVETAEELDRERLRLGIVLSGWRPGVAMHIDVLRSDAPEAFQRVLAEVATADGSYLTAKVNLGAEHPNDLYFRDWRIA